MNDAPKNGDSDARQRCIAFSFAGGQHQFLHGAPVAAALSRRECVDVEAFVLDGTDAEALRTMLRKLGAGPVRITAMTLPRAIERLAREAIRKGKLPQLKVLRLSWWRKRIRAAHVIVTLERTSTLLKQLPGRCPPIVHIPHGVGGARRAGGKGFDKRFALFDLAMVAGESDRESTVALGLLPPEKIAVTGQVKIAGLRRMGLLQKRSLFDNDRPTILYNPHFHSRRGSWQAFGPEIVKRIAADGRFNLIVAPHVRLFENAPAREHDRWRALSNGGNLLFDPGSERSMDMSYTLAADIYLGEFSSQLYEFLIHPRPCVFIDVVGDRGADDTQLPTMWRLGEIVSRADEVVLALTRATGRHDEFAALQRDVTRRAYGDPDIDAAEISANALLALA